MAAISGAAFGVNTTEGKSRGWLIYGALTSASMGYFVGLGLAEYWGIAGPLGRMAWVAGASWGILPTAELLRTLVTYLKANPPKLLALLQGAGRFLTKLGESPGDGNNEAEN